MSLSIDEIRDLFPALKKNTYLLTAAVGPLPRPVCEAYQQYYARFCEEGDLHWVTTLGKMEALRTHFNAHLGGRSSGSIGFCPNTSHGMNLLAMMLQQTHPGGEILTSQEEFPASTTPWYHHGFQVRKVPTAEILEHLSEKTCAVVLSHVQFSTGYRSPIAKIGPSLYQKKIPLILNATQSIGASPIHLAEWKVSAMTASCHKWFCAGYGLSVLYVDEDFRASRSWPMAGWLSVQDPQKMENHFPKLRKETSAVELGVLPLPVLMGAYAALELVEKVGIDWIYSRIQHLSRLLVRELKKIKGVTLLSLRDSLSDELSINSGTLLLKCPGDMLKMEEFFIQKKVYVSFRRGSLRVAVHYYNNEQDILRFTQTLKQYLELPSH